MTIAHHPADERSGFEPRHVLVAMFGTAAILYAAAVYSMTPAEVPLPRNVAVSSNARAPEAVQPVQSLGYVVFDWSEADGTVPGFGPLTGDGQ